MSLAIMRDLRPELRLTTPEELAAFEHDLLSEFVLARASVGISDGTVAEDVGVIVEARSRFTRPLREMEPRDLDRLFGRHQQGMAHATKVHKAHSLSVYFEFLELRHKPAIHRDGRSNSALLKVRSASNSLEAKPLWNRRRPQKNRLWPARYPYPAHPAMSDRFTVGREQPHSTGVESTIQLAVEPEVHVDGERPYFLLDQWKRGAQPLVPARLPGHVREHPVQAGVYEPQLSRL